MEYLKEDNNKPQFKPKIIDEILDKTKQSSKTRKASFINGSQLNVIALIVELLKIFSEVTVVSTKCGPLARIENLIMSTGPDEKFL